MASDEIATSEQEYIEKYRKKVIPFFEQGKSGTFSGKDGVEIAYRTFETTPEKAALVIFPGRGEQIIKYAEILYDLRDLGFSTYIMTHRGQGESGLVDQIRIQYVEDFNDYLDDAVTFIDQIVNAKAHSKRFLLAHSMGGAIGALHILNYPSSFDAAVFSAPMFDMNTSPYPKRAAYAVAKLACQLGMGKFQGAIDRKPVTSSEARMKTIELATVKYPDKKPHGVSYRWVWEALQAIRLIEIECSYFAIPSLLLQAGKDVHVKPAGQDYFCEQAKNCKKLHFSDSLHELMMEKDSIRTPVFEAIKQFFQHSMGN